MWRGILKFQSYYCEKYLLIKIFTQVKVLVMKGMEEYGKYTISKVVYIPLKLRLKTLEKQY